MRKLIVTADDFGYCDERNRGIVECFKEGIVTSTCILITLPSASAAVNLAKEHNLADVGLHLNFTEGPPASPPSKIPSLLNTKGEFKGKFGFREAQQKGEINMKEVEMETKEQILKFIQHFGHPPSFLNGHNHAHIVPEVASVVAKVCVEMGVKRIRIPFEDSLSSKYPWLNEQQLAFFRNVLSDAEQAASIFKEHSLIVNNYFIGLAFSNSHQTVERLSKAFSEIPDGATAEFMAHPGYTQTSGNGDDFSYSSDRQLEMNNLKNSSLKKMLHDANITLISWSQLSN